MPAMQIAIERGQTQSPVGKKVPVFPPISKKQNMYGIQHYWFESISILVNE